MELGSLRREEVYAWLAKPKVPVLQELLLWSVGATPLKRARRVYPLGEPLAAFRHKKRVVALRWARLTARQPEHLFVRATVRKAEFAPNLSL